MSIEMCVFLDHQSTKIFYPVFLLSSLIFLTLYLLILAEQMFVNPLCGITVALHKNQREQSECLGLGVPPFHSQWEYAGWLLRSLPLAFTCIIGVYVYHDAAVTKIQRKRCDTAKPFLMSSFTSRGFEVCSSCRREQICKQELRLLICPGAGIDDKALCQSEGGGVLQASWAAVFACFLNIFALLC